MAGCHYRSGPITDLAPDNPKTSRSHVRNRHGDANDTRAIAALETEIGGQVGKHSGRCAVHDALRTRQPLADCFTKSWPSFANTFMPDSSLAALARSDSSSSPTNVDSPVAPLGYVAREHPGEDRPSRFHANEIVRMVHAAGAGSPVCAPKSEIDEVFRYRSYCCPSCATIVSGIVVSGIEFGNAYRPA